MPMDDDLTTRAHRHRCRWPHRMIHLAPWLEKDRPAAPLPLLIKVWNDAGDSRSATTIILLMIDVAATANN